MLLCWKQPAGQLTEHVFDKESQNKVPVHERHSELDGPEHERQDESQLQHFGEGLLSMYWTELQLETQWPVEACKYKGELQERH